MWLIRICEPSASLGQFGHPFWCRLPLNAFEKPFVECSEKFFGRSHAAMLARPAAAVPDLPAATR
jgi:hypothetical protein